MSAKRSLIDDKHSITNNWIDITKHLTISASESIATSYDTVAALVKELVEVTTNHYVEEKASRDKVNKCQTTPELKESADSIPNSTNSDELPVRRSSRIQRLSVQGDVKKKGNKKDSKQSKNAKVTAVIEKDPNDIASQSAQVMTSDVKEAAVTLNESDSNCAKSNDEAPKKVQKRVPKKDEKDVIKSNEKNKSDNKKRTYNKKKKLSSSELEKSIDQVICDVINASIIDADPSEESKTDDLNETSNTANDGPLPNETPTSDVSVSNSKPNDAESVDCKDKPTEDCNPKPVKLKSRWCRSSELEGVLNTEANSVPEPINSVSQNSVDEIMSPSARVEPGETEKMETDEQQFEEEDNNVVKTETKVTVERPVYEHIDDNIYRFTRKKSKSKKQVRRMVCDCTLTKEEQECGILGCKEECLNRLLMIECGYRCPLGEACSNKKFEKKQYVKSEIFKADKKGWGLQALEDILRDDLIIEFVGEVVNHKEYRQRVKQYAKEKVVHSYFMALKTDEILDATIKGNYSRFINHSCDPNCETQKWTVNGELRVGVFAKRSISAGEEFTLDYKFQRYGREAQKCLCGSYNCSGYIGGAKQISIDAYSVSKSGTTKKKKGPDDKKRDLDDIALEEEIEKLNTSKGLRNKEETLKLARLMVRADESATRHQLLDIIIKTEEQACLRLFLDYHGLPLVWSWMTDIVDLDLKAKILQVLALLPISNKTMLLDSKVMNVVEKWVQEYNSNKKDDSTDEKPPVSALTSPSDETSEPVSKKLKNIEFSDSETDSTGSHNANDNSSETSSITDNFKAEVLPGEVLVSGETEPSKEIKLLETGTEAKEESVVDPNVHLKASISNIGAELLNNWKNLKEVFRIPRLEQQKRKEDEMEADHSVLMRTEKKTEVEVTGDHIQVLVSKFSPRFSDNVKIYENDNPEVDLKAEDHSNNNLLAVHTTFNKRFVKPSSSQETVKRKVNEEFKAPLESEPSTHASALLRTLTFLSQPPVNFPPPLNPAVASCPLLKQPPPQTMYPPPQLVYPQSQVPFVNTAAPPPVISHPPSSMPPPAQVLPQTSPSLLPTPTNYPPPGTSLPPPGTNLPPPNTNIPPPNTSLPPPNTSLPPPNTNLPPPNTNLPPPNTNLPLPNTNLPPPNTNHLPPNTNHPPPNTSLPPPNTNHLPPNTNHPPPNTNIPPPVNAMLPSNPPNFQLPPSSVVPPNMPPPGTHYIPNQPPANYPPVPNHFGNQNQPYYYGPPQQQPPLQTVPSSSSQGPYAENVCIQTSASLPLPAVNHLQSQAPSYSSSNSHPIQSITSLPVQSTTGHHMNQPTTYLSTQPTMSVPLQTTAFLHVDQTAIQPVAPIVVEEPKPVKLPKNWRSATDAEGNVYYYHSVTRLTQWDPPTSDQIEEDSDDEEEDSESEESESEDTPTYDEPKISTKHSKRKSKKRKTTKAAADTSVNFPVRPEVAKKIKELFRTKMSSYIVHCLNVYRKPDCKVGRITSNDDFKYLARKLTHYTMTKELKQCKNVEDLDCNEQVMHKARDFIKKYMAKYGSKYSRKEKFSPET